MPKLIIIAGCNGAGKSTFASTFLPDNIHSFDYDKLFLQHYNSLPDSELREEFAKNAATTALEDAIANSLQSNTDFCYETNFDVNPIYWAEKFKERGFTLNVVFFCLDNKEIARHRVYVRTEFKGHFVNDEIIDAKWKAGYKNINAHYTFFDNLLIVDNSITNEVFANLVQIKNGNIEVMTDVLPDYFERRFPTIYELIKNKD